MGEAKRRKKLDKNFSRSLTIKLIERTELTNENLIELIQTNPIEWFGEISKGDLKQQCGLIPFNNSKRPGKVIFSCHIILAKPYLFTLNQKEIDLLTNIAIRHILEQDPNVSLKV